MQNINTRSDHLKDIIKRLNEWAISPNAHSVKALREALNVYASTAKAKKYNPIGWEFAYPRNTINSPKAPKGSFASYFPESESAPKRAPQATPQKASTEGGAALPWED